VRNPIILATLLAAALAACGDDEADAPPSVYVGRSPRSATPVVAPTVLRAHPHDTTAYTQGLLLAGDTLFESTGRRGESVLRATRLATGEELVRHALPDTVFGEGLAAQGGRLWQVTWKSRLGFLWDRAGLDSAGTFAYEGEGWGLASDGRLLYLSDGTEHVRVYDPEGFRPVRTIEVTDGVDAVAALNELEWVRGELWANIWQTDQVVRFDPATGRVTGWLDLSGLRPPETRGVTDAVANGIAHDSASGRTVVTGKLWPVAYEIALPGNPAAEPSVR
jgi:glutamine cyclotransferase